MSSKSDKSGVTTIVRIARPEPKWVAPSAKSQPEGKWTFRPGRPANVPFGPLTREMAERPVVPEKPYVPRSAAPESKWVFCPGRPANAPFGPLPAPTPEKPFSAPSGRVDAPRVVWVTE